jgi:hypothetical protein
MAMPDPLALAGVRALSNEHIARELRLMKTAVNTIMDRLDGLVDGQGGKAQDHRPVHRDQRRPLPLGGGRAVTQPVMNQVRAVWESLKSDGIDGCSMEFENDQEVCDEPVVELMERLYLKMVMYGLTAQFNPTDVRATLKTMIKTEIRRSRTTPEKYEEGRVKSKRRARARKLAEKMWKGFTVYLVQSHFHICIHMHSRAHPPVAPSPLTHTHTHPYTHTHTPTRKAKHARTHAHTHAGEQNCSQSAGCAEGVHQDEPGAASAVYA